MANPKVEARRNFKTAAKNRTHPRSQNHGQTKFDQWLQKMAQARLPIIIYFTEHPFTPTDRMLIETVIVIEVDRYMLLLEFDEGETFWVSKSIIAAAGLGTDD